MSQSGGVKGGYLPFTVQTSVCTVAGTQPMSANKSSVWRIAGPTHHRKRIGRKCDLPERQRAAALTSLYHHCASLPPGFREAYVDVESSAAHLRARVFSRLPARTRHHGQAASKVGFSLATMQLSRTNNELRGFVVDQMPSSGRIVVGRGGVRGPVNLCTRERISVVVRVTTIYRPSALGQLLRL